MATDSFIANAGGGDEGPRSPFQITLSDDERAAPESIVAKRRSEQRVATRARIVLLAIGGTTNVAIAARLGIALNSVIAWRKRFFEERVEGLKERKRRGGPRCFPPRWS